MCRFVESIKYLNNVHYNLDYHQARFDKTRSVHFPGQEHIELKNVLIPTPALIRNQVYKCRLIYGNRIMEVTYEPYLPRVISQYYLVVCPDSLDYTHKLADRTLFDNLRKGLKDNEDYIYIKKGCITDTSYANIVFSDGKRLVTPANPLLEGTKRAYYINEGLVREEEIKVNDLPRFESMFVINAMLDLEPTSAYSCDKLLLSHNHLKL